MSTYNKVLIITRPGDDERTLSVREKIIMFCDDNDITWDTTSFPKATTDVLVIAIGGDGTMLGAMRKSLHYPNAIVYGINTGSLGFLSEEFNDNINTVLSNIGRNFGQIDERMALTGRVFVDGKPTADKDIVAINELVLSGMTNQAPVKVEVSINKRLVSENVGSGVLVATSTGSTAMALSAGGAIVSPSTNIMQIVPLMAHTLTSRPVITTGRDSISLKTKSLDVHQPIEVYGDGVALGTFYDGSGKEIELRINKHPGTVRVYRPHNWDFFNVLRKKMKW